MKQVAIVQTGVGNLASLEASFVRLGVQPVPVNCPAQVLEAERLVLPGVGAFAAAIDKLRELNLIGAIQQRVQQQRPTLAICLGMQLLGLQSEESPECCGLELLAVSAKSFPLSVTVPQIGWNRVQKQSSCKLLCDGDAYFANSFRWPLTTENATELRQQNWSMATANHGGEFIAAVERGPVLACQFHPELSGEWGQQLLQRWLQVGGVPC
jgi:imidazole glycerol-phosphate synthase subunit HisH